MLDAPETPPAPPPAHVERLAHLEAQVAALPPGLTERLVTVETKLAGIPDQLAAMSKSFTERFDELHTDVAHAVQLIERSHQERERCYSTLVALYDRTLASLERIVEPRTLLSGAVFVGTLTGSALGAELLTAGNLGVLLRGLFVGAP